MNTHPRLAAYLDAVTASLEGDDELRLDVRAELAAHLDEAVDRFQAEGHSPDESVDLAIQSLGPATDYAGDLVAANRRRMRLRGRIRLLLRALAIPVALAAVFVSLRGCAAAADAGRMAIQLSAYTGGASYGGYVGRLLHWLSPSERRYSREQRLILDGDTTRTNRVAGQRAIWEAWPTNVVYLNNYLTVLFSRFDSLGSTPAERLAALDRELSTAIALDPQNARYRYMRADKRLALCATVETIDLGKVERGESRSDYRLTVQDRAALDLAMAELLAGTRKPVLRRYAADMLCERLTIMGPPESLLQQIQEVGIAAGTLLPDLSAYRNLARTSIAYARLLIEEGRADEARPFIDAWQPLAVQVTDDSFTLIDVLVAAAIARIGQSNAAALYHGIGDTAAEARTRRAGTDLYAPVAAYRTRMKAQNAAQSQVIRQHAGVLTAMLLPALGEPVKVEELAAGRMVEYALLDQATCSVANLILLAVMFAALLIALRWWFVRGGAGAPLLLLPDAHQALRILGYGVVVPLLAYALWTRLPIPGGREVSLALAWPVAVWQAVLLVLGIVVVTVALSAQTVRARCETLQVPTPPVGKKRRLLWSLTAFGGLMLAIGACLRLLPLGDAGAGGQKIAGICLALSCASAGLGVGVAFLLVYLFGASRFGFYRGTVARSLIPHLAMAIVLITLLTNPYLRAAEARLVRTDPLMSMSQSKTATGFTVIEARLVERLRNEMLKAAGR